MTITMVRKIMPDNSPCPKCQDVKKLLEDRGYINRIDRTLDVSPKDPKSEGMQLVNRLKIKRAPFFLVTEDDGSEKVYDSVLRMIKQTFPEAN